MSPDLVRWEFDPFMPENQLPYLDGYRYVVYADSAAKVAGFRTGQLDLNTHTGLSPKETASLKNTNPEIRSTPGFTLAQFAPVRVDEEPWSDIRVRQAAMLAINHEEVRDAFFGGAAGFPAFPIVESVPGHLDVDGLHRCDRTSPSSTAMTRTRRASCLPMPDIPTASRLR